MDGLYTETVLVQVHSSGLRVDDPAVTDGRCLAAALVDAYLEQVFVLGVYHADPHPENLFIRPDGRICLHDFGIVGRMLRRLTSPGPGLRLEHGGLEQLEAHLDRAGNRLAVALPALGLYVAGSLLMLAAVPPHYRGVPVLALWFTLRLARREGREVAAAFGAEYAAYAARVPAFFPRWRG